MKSRSWSVLSLLLALVFASPASALTGDELFKSCMGEVDSAGYKQCESYIAGVVDGVTTLATSMKLLHPNGADYPKLFCVASSTPIKTLTDAVAKYLSRNANGRQYNAASEVLLALQETFPCPGV